MWPTLTLRIFISRRPWAGMNSQRCLSKYFQTISLHTTISEKALDGHAYMKIGQGIYRFPAQASILSNKLLKERLAQNRYSTLQASGSTFHAQYSSTCASMTLKSNILVMSTCDIFFQSFELKPLTSLKIRLVTYTVVSTLMELRSTGICH